ERDLVAGARRLDEATAAVSHATWPLPTSALDERGDARPIALHGAAEVVAEEATYAIRVAARRVEERHPARVGPGPHRTGADPVGHLGVQDGDAGRVGAEQPGSARLLGDEASDGSDQVDVRRDTASQSLGSDGYSGSLPVLA